jgi:DNA alkylation repair enzyme
MSAKAIVAELARLGGASYKKVILTHGAREPVHGVRVEDLKKIHKRVGTDYQLALELWDTGVYDAMYLAGLVADDPRMQKRDLQKWVEGAYCAMLAEYTVAWVAAGSPHGRELGLKWIDSKQERIASSGWATLGSLTSITPDEELDRGELRALLGRVEKTIHQAPNRERYVMNGFVVSTGCFVKELTPVALATGKRMGPVQVDMHGTACKVPSAVEMIGKVKARGTLGKKRKSAKC